jgi:hypothetical protein
MEDQAPRAETERDWRLQGELRMRESHGTLHALLDRIREPEAVEELEAAVPEDVVVTHDSSRLFAYAADRQTIEAARRAIEAVLAREGIEGQLDLTHWEEPLDEWVGENATVDASRPAPAPGVAETRTMVASAGRMVEDEFEQTMLAWAARLGLQCSVVEHPHLLSSQIAFTVTGSKRKVDEFSSALQAEGRATIRTETAVILSPL